MFGGPSRLLRSPNRTPLQKYILQSLKADSSRNMALSRAAFQILLFYMPSSTRLFTTCPSEFMSILQAFALIDYLLLSLICEDSNGRVGDVYPQLLALKDKTN